MKKFPVPSLRKFTSSDGVVIDLSAILSHNYDDIGEASSVLPPHIGYFGYLRALAVERSINGKQRIKQAEAKAYFELKNGGFQAKGYGEKITEAALEHAVQLDPEVIRLTEEYAAAERDEERHEWAVDALKAKLDLVRSVETTRRIEHEPDRNKGTVV